MISIHVYMDWISASFMNISYKEKAFVKKTWLLQKFILIWVNDLDEKIEKSENFE